MAKTLNHYSQQIKALAPDAVALDRAKQLGDLLISAKAAVKAANKLWTDWLQSDCELSPRTAGRFMTIAKRWNDPAFVDARNADPKLPIREADKVLAANSTRKPRAVKETPESKAWARAFESAHALTGHHCPHPWCCGYATAHPTRRLFCAGGGGSQPHDPAPMVSEAQGSDDEATGIFMVKPGDSAAKPHLQALLPLARQIRTTLSEANLFQLSSNSYLIVSNAADANTFPTISVNLSNGKPVNAFVGSIVNQTYITVSDGSVDCTGDCSELMPVVKKLMEALEWEG